MSFHPFEPRNACSYWRHKAATLARHTLIGEHFEEFGSAQAAAVARSTFGRQNVIGAGALIAKCYCRLFSKKKGAITAKVFDGARASRPEKHPKAVMRMHACATDL